MLLVRHPASPGSAPCDICVSVQRRPDGGLVLNYLLTGDLSKFTIPALQTDPEAQDYLWQHTCFEAFVARPGATGYHEFNFAPSGCWTTYRFNGYRQRHPWRAPCSPVITIIRTNDRLALTACLDADLLPEPNDAADLEMGLTAVVESAEGQLTYWALHHPAPQPDFHDRAGFVIAI